MIPSSLENEMARLPVLRVFHRKTVTPRFGAGLAIPLQTPGWSGQKADGRTSLRRHEPAGSIQLSSARRLVECRSASHNGELGGVRKLSILFAA